jgi:hypothetical protein
MTQEQYTLMMVMVVIMMDRTTQFYADAALWIRELNLINKWFSMIWFVSQTLTL